MIKQEEATSTKVITGKVRLSYAHLFKPTSIDDTQEPKYSVCLLIPKTDKETLTKIKEAIAAAQAAGKAGKWGGKIPPICKLPIRDGDSERAQEHPEYAGHYFMNANSKQKPGVVDRQCQEILDSSEVYSGCYARASINFYAYDKAGNKGIACGLNNIQKIEDGEHLGGRARAEDDFESLSEDDVFGVEDDLPF